MQHMKKHSVDLIYLDPPFNSQHNYNLMYKAITSKLIPERAEAFCDIWEWVLRRKKLPERCLC